MVRGALSPSRDLIFRGTALLGIIVVAAAFAFPQQQSPGQSQSYTLHHALDDQEKYSQSQNELFLVRTFADPIALFTLVLAISTVGLWIVTWRSSVNQSRDTRRSLIVARHAAEAATRAAQSSRDQVEHSRSAVETTERAFVILEPILHKKETVDHVQGWSFRCVWKNVGKTPTKFMLMSAGTQWRINAGPLPPDFTFDDTTPPGRAFLGPQNTRASAKFHFPDEVLVQMKKGVARGYLWGWVEYNDVFKDTPRHRTEFCAEVVVVGDPSDDDCGFSYASYGPFNGMDDECLKRPKPYSNE